MKELIEKDGSGETAQEKKNKESIQKAEEINQLPQISDNVKSHRTIVGSHIFRAVNDLKSELNHDITNYYQVGKKDYKKSLLMSIIQMDYSNSYYSELRTKKQLGYVVFTEKTIIDGIMYYIFLIQGRTKTPDEMNTDIDIATEMVLNDKISKISEDDLNLFKSNLKEILNKEYVNLKEKSDEIWKEIESKSYDFNRKKELMKAMLNITLSQVKDLFSEIFFNKPNKLSIQLFSSKVKIPENKQEPYYLNKKITSFIGGSLSIFEKSPIL
eukprot:CAMPEP_0170526434 /NCGR_PEP_ID=MMETSP0209-20121228/11842_1 /TAXON_ID=665100 ORGANISM="Litonotus pictus, Strain P1" /NCGR_SAMPLE_ID=MMETSP0209 /ASSEMBLY_ACC=CAM_ASM_000301 /LENGTH=269 /DNA_ID=CAMNT_0010816233 /DNA_START=2473 /DNA_END=3278 /DNA_ORIENTATION=-